MPIRFSGTAHGHEFVLDSDESLVVIDQLRLFVDGDKADERKITGGSATLQASVDGEVWDVKAQAGAVVGSVHTVTVNPPGREPVELNKE